MSQSAVQQVEGRVLGRYRIGRPLGAGTFGAVYEVRDETTGERFALKKLSELDAGAIYAFKQEFRALAEVMHPNLVTLHELFSVDDQLYLVMELVEGVNFLEFVRAGQPGPDDFASAITQQIGPGYGGSVGGTRRMSSASADTMLDPSFDPSLETVNTSNPSPSPPPVSLRKATRPLCDFGRLRSALAQLAAGIHAIHNAGKLHRDLKPSNVMVSSEGWVKILDFGLVANISPRSSRHKAERRIVGTPAYMSPEQAKGAALSPATDWYSFGVMLYEALTGSLPISGSVGEILAKKEAIDPPDPRVLAHDLPEDLAELCVDLLRRDPCDRPSGAIVLRALGIESGEPTSTPAAWSEILPFIGREHHFAVLEEAFNTVRTGKAVTLYVHGTSGMGKSALIRRFLDNVVERAGAVILEGKCYERENVPYKAVDSLIDSLTQHLRGIPHADAAKFIPRDIQALARLFPVLRRVPVIAKAPAQIDAPDLQELRRRAFGALREILTRMAAEKPLVVYIDDLQWGDADSAALLMDLLEPPDPPGMLLLASYRSEDAATIDFVRVVRQRLMRGDLVSDVRELVVGPLTHREARALARVLLTGESSDIRSYAELIAIESGGNAFFVHELVRHVRERIAAGESLRFGAQAGPGVTPISLQQVLARRLGRLPVVAMRFLEVIAVAGRPIALDTVCHAAEISIDLRMLAVLRGEHLIRSRGSREQTVVEAYHDRIREAVVTNLSPQALVDWHRRLAAAFEATEDVEPEALLHHYLGAGDVDRARVIAVRAADRAAEALAFDRAAVLYRKAIELSGEAPQPLRAKLAHALANAGRGAEAGQAFLEATAGAPADQSLELRRCAAEQFLRSGHIAEGLEVVQQVLQAVDLSLPKTPARALTSLVFRRAQISIRGFDFKERSTAEVNPLDLVRIDVCWSVGNGLGGVDSIRAADFQARHLLLALRAGEPYRIARALAWEAIFSALEGGRAGRTRAASLIARSTELAQRIEQPYAIAWATGAAAGAAYYDSRFRETIELSDRAVLIFREKCVDITWELGSILGWWLLPSFWYLGDYAELARRLPPCLREAEELGALYNETSMRTYAMTRLWLSMDRPHEARRETAEAMQRWGQTDFQNQHVSDLYARVYSHLYESDGISAHTAMTEGWPQLDRAMVLRLEQPRGEAHFLRGASAIVASSRHEEGVRLLKVAERDAKALEREKVPLADAYALMLRAGVAVRRGKHEQAIDFYARAEEAFVSLDMIVHAAAAQRNRGEVTGGDEGHALVDEADKVMRSRKVVNPERMAAMLAPW